MKNPGFCKRCGGGFDDIAWKAYREYAGASEQREPVSPCCLAGYEDIDAPEPDFDALYEQHLHDKQEQRDGWQPEEAR